MIAFVTNIKTSATETFGIAGSPGMNMDLLKPAQLGAMFLSLLVFGLAAKWYAFPWLQRLSRAQALTILAWAHVFRYVTLILFSSQRDGYPISMTAAIEAVVGDVLGALVALGAITMLRRRALLGVILTWLLVVETILDMMIGIRRKRLEPLWGAASGVTWLILDFYIPLLLVNTLLLIWQLYARRLEPLTELETE